MSTPAARTPAGRDEPQPGAFQKFLQIGQQVFFAWAIAQLISRFLVPQPSPGAGQGATNSANVVNPFSLPPKQAFLAWPLGQRVSMHVYLSTSPNGDVFSGKWTSGWRDDLDAGLPNFVWDNITFGDWNDARVVNYDVQVPESVHRNGSLWADVFLVKDGSSPDPSHPTFDPLSVHHIRKLLTPYMPKAKIRKEKNLLGGKQEMQVVEEEAEEPQDVILPHWSGNLTLALVSDAVTVPYSQLPPVLSDHVSLVHGQRDETGTQGFYKPIVFPNDFWILKSQFVEVNATTISLPLQVVFQPMSYFKFQTFVSMTHGLDEAAKKQGSAAAGELDELKRMLVETNPWFLGVTVLVSVLHMVFEVLAFKSDVSHWRQKRELVGVSVRIVALGDRTIVTNVFVQFIILLYLIDNNTETSWMILFGSGVGVLIEAWKITKAVDISVKAAPPGSILPYQLEIKDKHVLNEDERKTQEYDKLAFRYVSYVAIPLLAGYSVYSLLYHTHRGWYSFVISTLTSFVYMFGFAQLVPQLIINYKLKSVAHMPMKAMIYKTLSTVVDDFFAFCIKMPLLHRLACFRDDVVFLIFLYQRWIYRIDPKRVNEYGQVLVEDIVAVDGSEESKKTK